MNIGNIIKCFFTRNDCYKAGETMKPRGVMVHSTASNNTSIARYVQPAADDPNRAALLDKLGGNRYGNHWNQSRAEYFQKFGKKWDSCVHAFIGELANGTVDAVQTMPWDRVAWHCADDANYTHISFEICEDDLTDEGYFRKVYAKAVELTAMLCKEYGLDPLADGVVLCHSEGYKRGIASNHGDVMHWFPKFGKSMDTFRADVAKALGSNGGSSGGSGSTGGSGSQGFTAYTVQVTVSDLNIRSGPGTNNASKGFIKPGVYTIVEESSGQGATKWGRLKSRAGWISLDYVKRLGSTGGSTSSGGTGSQGFTPYTVKVSVTQLLIRSGPGTNNASKGYIKPGVYTIVEESSGQGATKWGRLKSGAGWISLDYATKC